MASYKVKVTWVETDTNNAAMLGNDENEVLVEAHTPAEAVKLAAEAHLDLHPEDFGTGKYDIVAEHLDGSEVYSICACGC
jgi:hypothetical protein